MNRNIQNIIQKSIGWDVGTWKKSIDFFDHYIDYNNINTALELGAGSKNGGYSLYLAYKGINVLCTNVIEVSNETKMIHKQFNLSDFINYDVINALDMPKNKQYDLVVFKSVLGGLARNNQVHVAEKAIEQIYKSINKNGLLVFAENIEGTFLHKFFRNKFSYGKDGSGWKYFNIDDLIKIVNKKFDICNYDTNGVIACFGRTEFQRNLLSKFDNYIFNRITPQKYKYVFMCVCRKK